VVGEGVMTVQLSLIQDDRIKKTIITVPVDDCTISSFNPRITRTDEEIDKLAQRISQNGFEITRALWAYRNEEGYAVFAGGSRLEAAQRAALDEVPIVLHEGLTDEDKVRLAEQDNENDEYHEPVSPVDVWAHYAWLSEQGWTQKKIAKAKGVVQSLVSERITLHRLPSDIKDFIDQGLIEEGHLREISSLSIVRYFSDWLTTEQAQRELVYKAVRDKGKNGSKSVRAVREDVKQWKEFIDYAEQVYQSWGDTVIVYNFDFDPPKAQEYNAHAKFIAELQGISGAKTLPKIKAAERVVRSLIADNLDTYQKYIEIQSSKAALAAQRGEKETELLSRFICGDCRQQFDDWGLGPIHLVLTDPPYGKDYQSNRRWRTKPPDKITGDTHNEAMSLIADTLDIVTPHLADAAHVLMFCDWQNEPQVREIIAEAGLIIKGSLIWVKEEHSAGDLQGSFGPSHERIIHAVKGSPRVTPRIRDVLDCARSKETSHPNEKPIELLKALINSTTNEGDLVVDLFAGCASSLVAAMKSKREFFGVEIDHKHHEEGTSRLLKEYENVISAGT
jgi:site-specific DNA-methyltransferase (adenine-specific)